MGLYIEGIELPKKGRYTTFTVYNDGTVVYRFGGNPAGKATPAVDVIPVRHGRWIVDDITGLIKCSECKNDAPLDTTGGGQWCSPFCPTCGALMDKDGDGDE